MLFLYDMKTSKLKVKSFFCTQVFAQKVGVLLLLVVHAIASVHTSNHVHVCYRPSRKGVNHMALQYKHMQITRVFMFYCILDSACCFELY